MGAVPLLETHKTELGVATTPDMVASLGLCDEHATTWAPSPLFVCHLIDFVTIPFVLLHHALLAKIFSTD